MRIYPSSLQAVAKCPGQQRLCDELEKMEGRAPSSEAAAEGTRLHDILEKYIKGSIDSDEAIKQGGDNGYAIRSCLSYIAYVKKKFPDAVVNAEKKLSCEGIHENLSSAKIDFSLIYPFEKGLVTDWKFTFIDPPPAIENLQAACYAVAAADEYALESVETHIMLGYTGWWTSHEFDKHDIERARDYIRLVCDAAKIPYAPLVLSKEACRYCDAKHVCPAMANAMAMAVDNEFKVEGMTPDEAGKLLAKVQVAKDAVGHLENKVFAALEAGAHIDGFNLVPGRGSREWSKETDEEQLRAALESAGKADKVDSLHDKIILSPSRIEKLVGKSKAVRDALAPFIVKKDGKMTLKRVE